MPLLVYFYNSKRYHQLLDYATPGEIYDQVFETTQASEEALTAWFPILLSTLFLL